MIIQINDKSRYFAGLAKLMLSKETAKEIGYPVYHYPDSVYFIKLENSEIIGFASLRKSNSVNLFEYDFVVKENRGNGIYKELLSFRESKCKGVARIETCRDEVKKILLSKKYKPFKTNGSWTYFQKQL